MIGYFLFRSASNPLFVIDTISCVSLPVNYTDGTSPVNIVLVLTLPYIDMKGLNLFTVVHLCSLQEHFIH